MDRLPEFIDPMLLLAMAAAILLTVVKSLFSSGGTATGRDSERGTRMRSYLGESGAYSWVQVGVSIFAAMAGGFMIFGVLSMGAEGGVAGYTFAGAYVLGAILLTWALGQTGRGEAADNPSAQQDEQGLFTIDHLVENHAGPYTRLVFLLTTGFLFAGVLGAQFSAVAALAGVFTTGLGYPIVLIVGTVGTVLYAVVHGLRAVIVNDYIQTGLSAAVLLLVPYAVLSHVPAGEMLSMPHGLWGDESYGIAYAIVGAAFLIPSMVSRADLWQRIRLASSEDQVKALWLGTAGMVVFYVVMTACGAAAGGYLLQEADGASASQLFPLIVNTWMHPVVGAFAILAGFMAVLSSVDSYVNVSGATVGKVFEDLTRWGGGTERGQPDPDGRAGNDEAVERQKDGSHDAKRADETLTANSEASAAEAPEAEDGDQVLLYRLASLVVAVTAAVFAVFVPDIVDLVSASFNAIGVLLPVVTGAVLLKKRVSIGPFNLARRVNDAWAAVSIVLGVLALAPAFVVLGKAAFVVSVPVSAIAYAAAYFVTGSTAPEGDG